MSAELELSLGDARYHAFRDPATMPDFDDPVERGAMLAHRMTFATPDDALSMMGSPDGQKALAKTWGRLAAHERQLWRRRVAASAETMLTGRDVRGLDVPASIETEEAEDAA